MDEERSEKLELFKELLKQISDEVIQDKAHATVEDIEKVAKRAEELLRSYAEREPDPECMNRFSRLVFNCLLYGVMEDGKVTETRITDDKEAYAMVEMTFENGISQENNEQLQKLILLADSMIMTPDNQTFTDELTMAFYIDNVYKNTAK